MKSYRNPLLVAALAAAACSLAAIAPASAQATRTAAYNRVATTQPSTVAPSSALQGRRGSPFRNAAASQSTIAAPLTRAECETLGGTVKEDSMDFCAHATHYCRRVDQDGTVRAVCINEQ
ncbi:MAG: hypothetical protein JNJ73_06575 [Hyphomonadaceae bacterium]|nr:hypothetical protein [Hyphomonadaceae bacterium]